MRRTALGRSGRVPSMYTRPAMNMNWWWTAHPAAH
ncbi:trp operon leader peptide [Streptomyces inhibens]|uniref:Trp operon leader peptide n=1 Tax=Streptomyces inhibens TaxID=2293571 RepID=A0A371PWC6_STRIH|nr:trp operon leader peptide [Streptomyces inhibens]